MLLILPFSFITIPAIAGLALWKKKIQLPRLALPTFALLLLLAGTSFAATPACGSNITANTVFDSDLNCSSAYTQGAVVMNTSGVTLDCNGFTLDANGSIYGIYAQNVNYLTIKNCFIINASPTFGIRLDNVNSSLIQNTSIQMNTFGLYDSAYNLINNVSVFGDNSQIYFNSPTSSDVIGWNNITNSWINRSGIAVTLGLTNTLIKNTTINGYTSVFINGPGQNIFENVTLHSFHPSGTGYTISTSSGNELRNNITNSILIGRTSLFSKNWTVINTTFFVLDAVPYIKLGYNNDGTTYIINSSILRQGGLGPAGIIMGETANSSFFIVNSTYNKTYPNDEDGSTLNATFQYYVLANVTAAGVPSEGASVNITSVQGGNSIYNLTTAASGFTNWVLVTELFANGSFTYNGTSGINVTFFSNYTIYANKSGSIHFTNVTINESKIVSIDLSPTPPSSSDLIITLLNPPTGNVTHNKTINFTYEVNMTNKNQTNVELWLDGNLLFNESISDNTTLTHFYNTTYRTHSWYVFAYNTSNYNPNSTSTTRSFTVNFSSPMALLSPTDLSTLVNKTINFTYQVNTSIAYNTTIQLWLDGVNVANDTTLEETVNYTKFINVSYGNHTWYVFAFDTVAPAGNQSSAVHSFLIQFNTSLNLTSPLNHDRTDNSTINFTYTFNISNTSATNVELWLDGVRRSNDSIGFNTSFTKYINVSYGFHSWYVLIYDKTNLLGNETSATFDFEIFFNESLVDPTDSITIFGNSVLFNYQTANDQPINCSIILDSISQGTQTINSSQLESQTISVSTGPHSYYISCYAFDNYSYVINTTTRSFTVANPTLLNLTVNLTTFPQNIYLSPQSIFFDVNGILNVLYMDSNVTQNYTNIVQIYSNNTIGNHYRIASNITKQFFMAFRDSGQTTVLAFDKVSNSLYLFNLSGTSITMDNQTTTYTTVVDNQFFDPYNYAYSKQFETPTYGSDSFTLFWLPLTAGSKLIQKNSTDNYLQEVSTASHNRLIQWQTIANASNLSQWLYVNATACSATHDKLQLYSYKDGASTLVRTIDDSCYNQASLEGIKVVFEQFDGQTFVMVANGTNGTMIHNIERNLNYTFAYNISNFSNFFFITNDTFVFFSTEAGSTYAYSCYFSTAANCTKFSSAEYGIVAPFTSGPMTTSKRVGEKDYVVNGQVFSSDVVQFTYDQNLYDVKFVCYDETDEFRKAFTSEILTNSTDQKLENFTWGYVLPSSVIGSGTKRAYVECTNGTNRMYVTGLAGNFSINAFSLNTWEGTYYTFTVVNEFGVETENVKLTAFSFSNLFDTQVTIEQCITDFSGSCTMFLKPFKLYTLFVEADGYPPLNLPFVPTGTTAVQIKLSSTLVGIASFPSFESMFIDVKWSLMPIQTFYTDPFNVTFLITSNASKLEYFGMSVYYNGTLVYFQNVTTQSSGGILNYSANNPGTYVVDIWLKRENFAEYQPLLRSYTLGVVSGLVKARGILATGNLISGWGFFFFTTIVAMLVGGFIIRSGLLGGIAIEGASFISLGVYWFMALLYPDGVVFTLIGGHDVTIWMATFILSVLAFAVFFLKQYI